ncbi:hypothetical protein Drorol1_Dr00026486, partial [Drosera rotundifolia]
SRHCRTTSRLLVGFGSLLSVGQLVEVLQVIILEHVLAVLGYWWRSWYGLLVL